MIVEFVGVSALALVGTFFHVRFCWQEKWAESVVFLASAAALSMALVWKRAYLTGLAKKSDVGTPVTLDLIFGGFVWLAWLFYGRLMRSADVLFVEEGVGLYLQALALFLLAMVAHCLPGIRSNYTLVVLLLIMLNVLLFVPTPGAVACRISTPWALVKVTTFFVLYSLCEVVRVQYMGSIRRARPKDANEAIVLSRMVQIVQSAWVLLAPVWFVLLALPQAGALVWEMFRRRNARRIVLEMQRRRRERERKEVQTQTKVNTQKDTTTVDIPKETVQNGLSGSGAGDNSAEGFEMVDLGVDHATIEELRRQGYLPL